MLVTSKEILDKASAGNYGVAAAHVTSATELEAAVEAAEELRAPLILDMLLEEMSACPKAFCDWAHARCEAASVPVALNLDDCKLFENVIRGINCGVRSVIVNRSDLPFAENVAETRKVVEIAHAAGVSVEAELKADGPDGAQDALQLTIPEAAALFARETGVDCLAVSLRVTRPSGEAGVDFPRLKEIRAAVGDLPLALHGSLGLPGAQLGKACTIGLNKVNVSKDLKAAALQAVQDNGTLEGIFTRNENALDQIKAGVKAKMRELIELYGSAGKA